jgi:hypothetical protein
MRRGVKPRQIRADKDMWKIDEKKHGSRAVLSALFDVFFNDVFPMCGLPLI